MSFFSEYKTVNKLIQQKLPVVFYAESRHYYQYFEKLIEGLVNDRDTHIYYITSDKADPLLISPPAGLRVVYVKLMLGFLFSHLKAGAVIMTMPDLGNYLYKRSATVDCYVYVFHAAVSTHQQYSRNAFFHYDAIFCTGGYQEKEIRRAEQLYHQKEKEIIPYGYPLFDSLKRKISAGHAEENRMKTILLAPSWFDGCIFDTCIKELIERLSGMPYKVILRPHPEYEKRKAGDFQGIKKTVERFPNMSVDSGADVVERLPSTDILITDRSGIAFEFAFGTGRPVLFIDTKLKETNKEWRELQIEPIENLFRSNLGVSLSPSQLDRLESALLKIESISATFTRQIEEAGQSLFFNAETSYKKGIDYILSKAAKE